MSMVRFASRLLHPAFPALIALVSTTTACTESTSDPDRSRAQRPTDPIVADSPWGTHVLAWAEAPGGALWVGTYGEGIFVSRDGSGADWERILRDREDSTSISWNFVNSFAFADGEVWYGTIGNGWGVSRDGGRTWENWTFRSLGPRWQYVVPNGIVTAGDDVFIATADGLRITSDDGASYRDITDATGLPNKYLLGIVAEPGDRGSSAIRVAHLRGFSESSDGGYTWTHSEPMSGEEVREALLGECPDAGIAARICEWTEAFRMYPIPDSGITGPSSRKHFWLQRPVRPADNPHLDQTYTYGSTMGGNFQQHQGVEFNIPAGTPIHAAADGIVAFSGPAEAGANTVVIRHGRKLGDEFVWSAYYHNTTLVVAVGDSVKAGDLIATAGNTGRATNDHLHLEIHTTPEDDVTIVVAADERYPPNTRNPQLWIEPLPGTGAIAGRVFDSEGMPVPGARVYGVSKPQPSETPFSFAETYEDRANGDPVFAEHFVIGDVPSGVHVLGVEIEGMKRYAAVQVEAGRVTEVEFRP